MITEATRTETKAVIGAIDKSDLGEDRKSALRRLLVQAEEGTNGLTQKAKLQNVSESVFSLCVLTALGMVDASDGARRGLYRLLERTRWQVVLIVAIIGVLLAFRPELAELIGTLAGK